MLFYMGAYPYTVLYPLHYPSSLNLLHTVNTPSYLQQISHCLHLAIEHGLMQTVSAVSLQLSVDVKTVVDEQGDDVIVAGLGRQEEGCVGHPRPLQVRLRKLAGLEEDGHHLREEVKVKVERKI